MRQAIIDVLDDTKCRLHWSQNFFSIAMRSWLIVIGPCSEPFGLSRLNASYRKRREEVAATTMGRLCDDCMTAADRALA